MGLGVLSSGVDLGFRGEGFKDWNMKKDQLGWALGLEVRQCRLLRRARISTARQRLQDGGLADACRCSETLYAHCLGLALAYAASGCWWRKQEHVAQALSFVTTC